MVQNTLNLANIVACVAAAAGVPGAGGVITAISGTLSGTAVWRDLIGPERTRAQEMAEAFDRHLAQTHLTPDRRRIVAQVFHRFSPRLDDMAQGDMKAERIADLMRAKVAQAQTDPAYQTPVALDDYASALRAVLPLLLAPRDEDEAMQQDILRTVHELKGMVERSGRSDSLREEGITEKAIIRLAQRIARDTEDLGQAWIELQNAMDIAVQVQREGRIRSNHGDFVDTVLAGVAALAAEGDYAGASDALARALAGEDAAHRARKSRLLASAAEVAMLQGDAETAAGHLIAKADLDAGGCAVVDDLIAVQNRYHFKGRDTGTALDLEIAIALGQLIAPRASSADQRGTALNDLGLSLQSLGARESGTARLEDAVFTLRAALKETPRDRAPLLWAATQQNLGLALHDLGARENGTARLEEAVATFRVALEEITPDCVPLDWAKTQQNLGLALASLGERERNSARLNEALTAYRTALEEITRKAASLDKATIHMNLGNALATLGEFQSDFAVLEEAMSAYNVALEYIAGDCAPLHWAIVKANLAILSCVVFDNTGENASLERAEEHARAAREVFAEAGASHYIEETDVTLAAIAAWRGE